MMRPAVPLGMLALLALLTACDGARPVEPAFATGDTPVSAKEVDFELELVREVRALAQQKGVGALATRLKVRQSLVVLGQALAFDPLLSGTRDISCMTCHVPGQGTGDGRSLSVV